MKSIFVFVLSTLALVVGGTAYADAPAGSMKLQTVVQQIHVTTDKDGKSHSEVVPAGHVLPGVEVIYTINYEYLGTQPATDVVVTDPIPAQVTYVAGSVQGADTVASFSVDGGKTWGSPASLTVKNADGSTRSAQPADYTTIRWVIQGSLKLGDKGSVSFHAVVK
jgi:uncharacterized repeat protein (TIGR01451 family)